MSVYGKELDNSKAPCTCKALLLLLCTAVCTELYTKGHTADYTFPLRKREGSMENSLQKMRSYVKSDYKAFNLLFQYKNISLPSLSFLQLSFEE